MAAPTDFMSPASLGMLLEMLSEISAQREALPQSNVLVHACVHFAG